VPYHLTTPKTALDGADAYPSLSKDIDNWARLYLQKYGRMDKPKGHRIDARVLECFTAVGVTLLILLFLRLTFSDL